MNLTQPKKRTSLLDDSRFTRIIEEALLEDIGLGDVTTDSIVSGDLLGHGDIRVKADGVVAGLEIATTVFHYVDSELMIHQTIPDGALVRSGLVVATVDGSFASILKAERTVLNLLQRMSGIASLTRKFVDAVAGTRAKITDTRKTAPGLRILDKLAVELGGGVNHRFGLDDMVLIKDNHVEAAGGIGPAIDRCLEYLQEKRLSMKIEVETKNLAEVEEALRHPGIHRIMLDNFPLDAMQNAVKLVDRRVEVEASGNVTLGTVCAIAETGVDFISVGALTHSPAALDISLKVKIMNPNS